jgi:hypothetical protein
VANGIGSTKYRRKPGRTLKSIDSLAGDRKKKVKARLGRVKDTAKDGEAGLKGLVKR